jgi:steroid delta-isomerase-like uncharacterized protein
MSEQNKAISRRIMDEVWNQGNFSVADELIVADVVDHSPLPGLPPGREGFKALVGMYRTAFPNVRMVVEDQVAEGDRVVTRWSSKGTHQGDLMGIPPTGKQVAVTGISIERFAGGKVVETWSNFDQLGMLQQLGVVPAPGQ